MCPIQVRHQSIRRSGILLEVQLTSRNILERAESYEQHIKEDGLLEYPQELQKFGKKNVSVFKVEKRTNKICRFTKDTVIGTLMSLGIKPQRAIKGTVFFSCETYCYPQPKIVSRFLAAN